jgi:hypothetical protein
MKKKRNKNRLVEKKSKFEKAKIANRRKIENRLNAYIGKLGVRVDPLVIIGVSILHPNSK